MNSSCPVLCTNVGNVPQVARYHFLVCLLAPFVLPGPASPPPSPPVPFPASNLVPLCSFLSPSPSLSLAILLQTDRQTDKLTLAGFSDFRQITLKSKNDGEGFRNVRLS